MKRLTGLDAGFLWMETPSSAMHVSGLAIYDPSELLDAGGTFGIDNIRSMVQGRLHLAPPFRQRLVDVPLQIHFPLWIEDPHFDLDRHIRRVGVPAPGGPGELAELAAHLNATQLDRTRPLWELWYIEGLEDGRVATLTKVHHAAIDGASGSEITVALFDLSPEVVTHPEPDEPWQPDEVPSDVDMLRYAIASLVRQPRRVLRALRRTGEAALNVRSMGRTGDHGRAPLPFSAPATSINKAITARRSVAITSLSLADVKRVKNAFGCTVNDVILALCGGAMRRYFLGRGETVDGPLLAMVPVSVRAEDHRQDMGNQVSSMFTTLATDVADPVARLRAIHQGMRGAKEQHRAIGADTLTDWAEFAAPAVFGRAMRLYARMGLADRHRPVFNLTISNVPGPPFALYSAGTRLEANFPLGPIFDGAALNITAMSLEDSLDIGILTCPDVVDDVWAISGGLAASLDELLTAADAVDAVDAVDATATLPERGETERTAAPTTPTAGATKAAAKKTRTAKAAAEKTGANRSRTEKARPAKAPAAEAPAARTSTTRPAKARAASAPASKATGTKAPATKGPTKKTRATRSPTKKARATKRST